MVFLEGESDLDTRQEIPIEFFEKMEKDKNSSEMAYAFLKVCELKAQGKDINAMYVEPNFSDQIKQRQDKKQKLGITILKIDDPEIIDINIEKNKLCFIKLEFKSQQVQITKDSKNVVVDGNDNLILNITELWTFSKELKNKNPNWLLEKIEENA